MEMSECERKDVIRRVRQDVIYLVDEYNRTMQFHKKWTPLPEYAIFMMPGIYIILFIIGFNRENLSIYSNFISSLSLAFLFTFLIIFFPFMVMRLMIPLGKNKFSDDPTHYAMRSYCEKGGIFISLEPLRKTDSQLIDEFCDSLLKSLGKNIELFQFEEILIDEVCRELEVRSLLQNSV